MLIALLVTLACLPLLVLDVVNGSTRSGAASLPESSTDSSLVVATQVPLAEPVVDPSSVEIDSPSTEVAAAPTTAAPVTTTTVARQAQATTTTTAPRRTTTTVARSSDAEFLSCVRNRESHNDYTASDPTGTYLGAYQIYQGGWDAIAASIGRPDLVGVAPNHASPADQDAIAAAMLARHGRAPWGGSCG